MRLRAFLLSFALCLFGGAILSEDLSSFDLLTGVAKAQTVINPWRHAAPAGDPNLVLYFKFDETSGNASDSSSNSYTGTLQNGPTWTNPGLELDGSDDYVDVNNDTDLLDGKAGFTISFLANLDVWGSYDTFFYARGTSAHTILFYTYTGGRLRLTVGNGVSSTINCSSNNDINVIGTQTHYAVVFDGTAKTCYFYKDYVGAGSEYDASLPSTSHMNSAIVIGDDDAASGRHVDGNLEEFKVWDKALSSSEIADLEP